MLIVLALESRPESVIYHLLLLGARLWFPTGRKTEEQIPGKKRKRKKSLQPHVVFVFVSAVSVFVMCVCLVCDLCDPELMFDFDCFTLKNPNLQL